MRMQLEDSKIPPRAFTVKCPRCQTLVSVNPPASEEHAADSGNGTNGVALKLDKSNGSNGGNVEGVESSADAKEFIRLLTALLQKGADRPLEASRLSWELRRALVGVGLPYREKISRVLSENDYQVFVAEDAIKALERMREERMHIVILDPEFDQAGKGAAAVTREINSMRPVERRRLYLVLLSSMGRTLDQHAAFVSNANLIVNSLDINQLPKTLERSIRDFNHLYRHFNSALNIGPL